VSGRVKKFFVFLFFASLLCSCAKISVFKKGTPIYTGKLWLDFTFRGRSIKRICTYGEFKSCNQFFFLRIRGPFGSTLGELFWEKKSPAF